MITFEGNLKELLKREASRGDFNAVIKDYLSKEVTPGLSFNATIKEGESLILASVIKLPSSTVLVFETSMTPTEVSPGNSYRAGVSFSKRTSLESGSTGLGITYSDDNLSRDGITSMHISGIEKMVASFQNPSEANGRTLRELLEDYFRPNENTDTVDGVVLR